MFEKWGQVIYVVANAETTHGFNIATEPMLRLDRRSQPSAVGSAVLKALNAYKQGVPVPDLKKLEEVVLSFTGHKSSRAFERDLSCLFIQVEGEKIKITPTVKGDEGGFVFQQGNATVVDFDPESIGRAISRMLESSELPG